MPNMRLPYRTYSKLSCPTECSWRVITSRKTSWLCKSKSPRKSVFEKTDLTYKILLYSWFSTSATQSIQVFASLVKALGEERQLGLRLTSMSQIRRCLSHKLEQQLTFTVWSYLWCRSVVHTSRRTTYPHSPRTDPGYAWYPNVITNTVPFSSQECPPWISNHMFTLQSNILPALP